MSKKILLLFFLTWILSSQSMYGQEKSRANTDSCLSYLEIYSHYWKKDSLGKNGFRELMSNCILENCSFEGIKWKDISKYLGSPNSRFNIEGKQFYRYRLNYQSKDIREVGTKLLTIEVDKLGLIFKFSISFVDG